jgi:hypothetical protein
MTVLVHRILTLLLAVALSATAFGSPLQRPAGSGCCGDHPAIAADMQAPCDAEAKDRDCVHGDTVQAALSGSGADGSCSQCSQCAGAVASAPAAMTAVVFRVPALAVPFERPPHRDRIAPDVRPRRLERPPAVPLA